MSTFYELLKADPEYQRFKNSLPSWEERFTGPSEISIRREEGDFTPPAATEAPTGSTIATGDALGEMLARRKPNFTPTKAAIAQAHAVQERNRRLKRVFHERAKTASKARWTQVKPLELPPCSDERGHGEWRSAGESCRCGRRGCGKRFMFSKLIELGLLTEMPKPLKPYGARNKAA